MTILKNFIEISRFAGERFDLVQASGGNSSVKISNNEMLIKSSGFLLSDISKNWGYTKVNYNKINKIFKSKLVKKEKNKIKREIIVKKLISKATIDKRTRPSIETLLHSSLYKYTLHTHPVVVNMILIQKNWKQLLKSIFNNHKIALVGYKTPGIELALELDKTLCSLNHIPKIIFLQNHGLIVTSNKFRDIKLITEMVLIKIEKFLNVDMKKYKMTNLISKLIFKLKKQSKFVYLSEDRYLNEQLLKNKILYFQKPFCPDSFVFCGANAIEIKNFLDVVRIKNYIKKYFEIPSIIIYKKYIFIIASNSKKAKEIEEVLKLQIMVLEKNKSNKKNFLKNNELYFLNNWEAEKFRKKI